MSTPRLRGQDGALRLTRRRDRERTGRFLAEGPQAVREALAAGAARELLVTEAAAGRHPELVDNRSVPLATINDRVAASLSETAHPQGIVAVCAAVDVPLERALAGAPRLVCVLVAVRDPGNAGTVLRCADAAGADAVILAGQGVDPYNGKCVRASAGSLFHVPLSRVDDAERAVAAVRARGLSVLAADAAGETGLDEAALSRPTAWLFGNEAWGLPEAVAALADDRVRIPIYGRAESLNLAAAAAICLYASARAHRASLH